MYQNSATIFALSSGAVPSGVAVVRVSGRHTRFAVETICGSLPPERIASLRSLRKEDGTTIDRGLVIFFGGPASFTGEDVAEFHLHGGRAVVAAVLERLASLPEFRAAAAGEFTQRAFLNGKLDLTAAEALADLVDAETEFQRRLAIENAGGAQARLYDSWRVRLVQARALIEAELDFADEGDVPGSVADAVWEDVTRLCADVICHRESLRDGEIVRNGFRVALVGAPNAGKSSLMNALVGREVAIVTPVAGTTRDVIEVVLDLGGARVRLFDTAGLRATSDVVERIGVERAGATAADADLVLMLVDPLSDEHIGEEWVGKMLRIGAKSDLYGDRSGDLLYVSSVTGEGLDQLVEEMASLARVRAVAAMSGVVPTRARHASLLDEMIQGFQEALSARALEIRSEGLRRAGDAVGRLTGVINTEELLGVIFSRFCIGK